MIIILIENQFKSGGLAGKSLAEVAAAQGISTKASIMESVVEEKGEESDVNDNDGQVKVTIPISSLSVSEEKETLMEDAEEDSLADVSLSSSSSDSSTEMEDIPLQWLRICTKTHRMSGVTFKTLVLLTGRVANLWSNPGDFFYGISTKGKYGHGSVLIYDYYNHHPLEL